MVPDRFHHQRIRRGHQHNSAVLLSGFSNQLQDLRVIVQSGGVGSDAQGDLTLGIGLAASQPRGQSKQALQAVASTAATGIPTAGRSAGEFHPGQRTRRKTQSPNRWTPPEFVLKCAFKICFYDLRAVSTVEASLTGSRPRLIRLVPRITPVLVLLWHVEFLLP